MIEPHPSTEISVCILDDDQSLREELGIYLTYSGMKAVTVGSSHELNLHLKQQIPHIVLVDINLPGESGFEIARTLRNTFPLLGIIVLTARVTPADRIHAYESGADFYLPKPIAGLELTHVIRSLYKRLLPSKPLSTWVLNAKQCYINPPDSTELIKLTRNESALLSQFTQQKNRILSIEEISLIISPHTEFRYVDKHNVEALLSRLRKKLKPWLSDIDSQLLVSVRSYGYQLSIEINLLAIAQN